MKDIIDTHVTWMQAMKYRPLSPLESLMLLVSEVGEAANALRDNDHENLEEELADIILRTIYFAHTQDIDIQAALYHKIEKNRAIGNKGRSV